MDQPTPEHVGEQQTSRRPLSGAVLWAGIAWLAVATLGLVPTALLFARGITAMIGYMVGAALVAVPLVTVFQLWYTRTVATAVRSAMTSVGLAALVFATWTGGRGFEPAVVGIAAVLTLPGVLSLFAARQLHLERRPRRGTAGEAGHGAEPLSSVEAVFIGLILVAVLFAAFLVLEPTFSTPIPP